MSLDAVAAWLFVFVLVSHMHPGWWGWYHRWRQQKTLVRVEKRSTRSWKVLDVMLGAALQKGVCTGVPPHLCHSTCMAQLLVTRLRY